MRFTASINQKNHLSWFPSDSKPSYDSIDGAIDDCKKFHKYLTDNGIKIKFIRVPYGLHTELTHYLQQLGVKSNQNTIARDIVKGRSANSNPKTAEGQVLKGFGKLKAFLSSNALHLWNGSSPGKPEIRALSWETESAAPDSGRADSFNKTYVEKLVKKIPTRNSKRASLIILGHDISAADAIEVKADIEMSERLAKENKVKVSYHTLSSLYTLVRKKSP